MKDKTFESEVAVITGAGQGIGYEISRMLAGNGASVLLNDINKDLARNAAERINNAYGSCCLAFPGDAADPEFPEKIVKTAVQHSGKLNLAVANAGLSLFGDFFDYTYIFSHRVFIRFCRKSCRVRRRDYICARHVIATSIFRGIYMGRSSNNCWNLFNNDGFYWIILNYCLFKVKKN